MYVVIVEPPSGENFVFLETTEEAARERYEYWTSRMNRRPDSHVHLVQGKIIENESGPVTN